MNSILALLALTALVQARPPRAVDQHPAGYNVAEPRHSTNICYVGSPPSNFAVAMHKIKIANHRPQPITLKVDSMVIQVQSAVGRGGLAPQGFIVDDARGREQLVTALMPGQSCYLVAPLKTAGLAKSDGWTILAETIAIGAPTSHWLPVHDHNGRLIGYKSDVDGILSGACERDTIKYRGKLMVVPFLKPELEDFNDGC